jgi:hypothetical protein
MSEHKILEFYANPASQHLKLNNHYPRKIFGNYRPRTKLSAN